MKQYLQMRTSQLVVAGLCFLFAFSAQAQTQRKSDIIQLRDNTKLEVLIQEVEERVVKYKKTSDPDGPLFSVNKADIVSIQYGNGEVETFEAVLEVPNYYSPNPAKSTGQAPRQTAGPKPAPGSKRSFLEEIRNSNSDHLRATYKFYKTRSKGGLILGIAGTSVSTIVAAVGTGIVVNSVDANGYYTSRQAELRARTGAWMMVGGLAGAITFATVGFVKAGKNGSKASRIKRELLKRGEPLTISFSPAFSPAAQAGSLRLTMNF